MSSDAVYGRAAGLSATSNMREVQAAYKLIVDCDFEFQNSEIRKRFVWMMSVDDKEYKQMGLFVKLVGRAIYKVLEVKKSNLEPVDDSGLGLFACINFTKGEIVTIYVGKVVEKCR